MKRSQGIRHLLLQALDFHFLEISSFDPYNVIIDELTEMILFQSKMNFNFRNCVIFLFDVIVFICHKILFGNLYIYSFFLFFPVYELSGRNRGSGKSAAGDLRG